MSELDRLYVPPTQLIGMDGTPIGIARAPAFDEEEDHKQEIFTRIGEIDGIFLFNEVLVAKYIREKISEHLVASAETRREDIWQGVVGLVLMVGPTAFQDDEATKFPWEAWIRAKVITERGQAPIKRGDWVLYRSSDGWDKDLQLTGEYEVAHCRVLQDAHIRGKVKYPGRWW